MHVASYLSRRLLPPPRIDQIPHILGLCEGLVRPLLGNEHDKVLALIRPYTTVNADNTLRERW